MQLNNLPNKMPERILSKPRRFTSLPGKMVRHHGDNMDDRRTRSQREFLSRLQIEERAAMMLVYVLPDRKGDYSPPDLQDVVSVLESQYRVRFSFAEDLGGLPGLTKILGIFSVAPLTIRICSSIPPWSPGFCKTLAHELGHLVLHRALIGDGKYVSRDKPIVDTARQLRYRETAELSDLGWVE